MKKILLILMFQILLLVSFGSTVFAQGKVFSPEELLQYDGKDGNSAYYAYEGKVYDVTGSDLWKEGQHYGLQAGQDLTGKLGDAPHGTEVFAPFAVMGTYEGGELETLEQLDTNEKGSDETNIASKNKWYQGRIRLLGFSVLGWTGIFLGLFFVLTFATCFALPWAKLPVLWKGSKIGPDPLDNSDSRLRWSSVHKHFVWWTVVLGIIHGVLGFLQMAGIYL